MSHDRRDPELLRILRNVNLVEEAFANGYPGFEFE